MHKLWRLFGTALISYGCLDGRYPGFERVWRAYGVVDLTSTYIDTLLAVQCPKTHG